MMTKKYKIETKLAHIGRDPKTQSGCVNPPVYHASTIVFPTLEALETTLKKPIDEDYRYGRVATPTSRHLESALTALEGKNAKGSIIAPSGLSAITTTLLAFLASGDHLLMVDSVYGPVRTFCTEVLPSLNIKTTFYDPLIAPQNLEKLIQPNTRFLFMESPGSLTFEIQDIPALVAIAKKHKLITLLDNSWATPLFFQPLDYGIDLSLHAITKYIGGHSDIMLGAVTANEKCYDILRNMVVNLGICAGPDDIWLALRGLRSLGTRMKQHQKSALILADWLSHQKSVKKILHPAHKSCPNHKIWKRDYKGSSGLFSIILEPAKTETTTHKALAALLDNMSLFSMGYSWGGFESLMTPWLPQKLRSATNWQEDGILLRLSIGLEDVDDLKTDLKSGLDRYHKICKKG